MPLLPRGLTRFGSSGRMMVMAMGEDGAGAGFCDGVGVGFGDGVLDVSFW